MEKNIVYKTLKQLLIFEYLFIHLSIYTFINNKLNNDVKAKERHDNGYIYFEINGEELFAVPYYHFGIENWLSHISILEFKNNSNRTLSLNHKNNRLFQTIEENLQNTDLSEVKVGMNNTVSRYQEIVLKPLNEQNLQGNKRLKVMPFTDIILNETNPLHISMDRNKPNLNWEI